MGKALNEVMYMPLETILERLESLSEDRTVPSNVREMLKEAINSLKNENEDLAVRVNAAISLLDEASNDPNIKPFTRTEIWSIASMLEKI